MYEDFVEIPEDELASAVAKHEKVEKSRVQILRSRFLGEGSNIGDGLTSIIKALEIEYNLLKGEDFAPELKTFHLMAKLRVSKGKNSKWWDEMKFFERETEFYDKLWPKLKEFGDRNGVSLSLLDIYFCQAHGDKILMQDLKRLGYSLVQNVNPELKFGMNCDQVMTVLAFLAKFHALGYEFLKKEEKFEEEFPLIANCGRLGQFVTANEEIVKTNYEMYLETSKKMVPLLRHICPEDKNLVSRFEKSLSTLAEKCGRTRNPDGKKFVTICHGDLWCNNILFKLGSGPKRDEIEDFKIIDFQECMISSPTDDLGVLLANSVTAKVRNDYQEEFLTFYHQELIKQMKILGNLEPEKIYSKSDLESDYRDTFGHGFYWGIMNAFGSLKKDGMVNLILGKEDKLEDTDFSNLDRENLPDGAIRILDLVQTADRYGYFD